LLFFACYLSSAIIRKSYSPLKADIPASKVDNSKNLLNIIIYDNNILHKNTFFNIRSFFAWITNQQKAMEYSPRLTQLTWCQGRDLNAYGFTTRPSNVGVPREPMNSV